MNKINQSPLFGINALLLLISLSLLIPSLQIKANTTIPTPSFESPRQTMDYFLSAMSAHKDGDSQALDLAVKALDTSNVDPTARRTFSRRAAENLINTLDRLERIDITAIPDETDGNTWYFRRQNILVDNERQYVEIAIGRTPSDEDDQKDVWLFTSQTVQTIGTYYRFVRHRPVVEGVTELRTWRQKFLSYMPAWTGERSFVLLNGQWLGIFAILLLALIIDKLICFYLSMLTRKLAAKKHLLFDAKKQKSLNLPITLIIFALFWNLGVLFLDFSDQALSYFLRGGRIIFTIGFVMTAYHIVEIVSYYFQELAKRTENKFDDILVPLVRKALKTVVIAIGIVAIGDSLTLDMKSILAGLGIGGIAFALAARDTISNMFGSVTVLLDRPFQIGDWVNIGGNVEGTVVEVGLRSTRIRTFYDSLITVPNGQLTNIHIDNYGMRTYRRFMTTLGLQYDTPPEKVEAFCEGIRQLVLTHEWTRKDFFHIYFNDFGNSSLNILVYIFFQVPDWSSEMAERHRLLLDILRLGHKLDIRFAFPTQTLHLYREEHKDYRPFDEQMSDVYKAGESAAKNILNDPITRPGHRSSANSITLSSKNDQKV